MSTPDNIREETVHGGRRKLGMATRVAGALLATLGVAALLFIVLTSSNRINDTAVRGVRDALKSDLRALNAAQSRFFADSGRYFSAWPDSMPVSSGRSKPQITLTADGWSATHADQKTGLRCIIYVGTRPADLPGVVEATPTCDR